MWETLDYYLEDPVPCIDDKNNSWYNGIPKAYSATQKDGIFVHRTNLNGFAGKSKDGKKAVSMGCILIDGRQWNAFERQIGKNGFTLVLRRQ